MYCRECGKEVSEQDPICPRCEAPLEPSTEAAMAKENRSKPAASAPAQKPEEKRGITISFSTALLLGILVIGTVLFMTHRNSPSGTSATQEASAIQWSPQVVSVAKHFICDCGECNLNLVVCTCKKPHGSVEMKTFIKNGLEEGKTPAQVVASVSQKYNMPPIDLSN